MSRLIGTIQAVAKPKERNGKLQMGFMIADVWHNMLGTLTELETIQKTMIRKGNTISFEIRDGFANSVVVEEQAKEEKKNWADEMVNFESLLSSAHKQFKDKMSIRTELIEKRYGKEMGCC